MSLTKRPDGVYVLRYYADGTKNSPQRRETLRGLTYAQAGSRSTGIDSLPRLPDAGPLITG